MCKQSELGCHAPTPVTLKALSHQMRRKKPEWIVLSHPKRNETGCYCSGRTGKWSSFSWLKRERLNASTAPSAGSSHVQQEHGCLNIYCSFYPLEWFLNLRLICFSTSSEWYSTCDFCGICCVNIEHMWAWSEKVK